MGKNQSKEHKYIKSKENTPQPEKRKEKENTDPETPLKPEPKRQSTLQALKDIATPPGLRKSESTRSRIRWPSSSKKTTSLPTLSSQSLKKPRIDSKKDTVNHSSSTIELKTGPPSPATGSNSLAQDSLRRHLSGETAAQIQRMTITSPTKSTPEKRVNPPNTPSVVPQAPGSQSQKDTMKENIPLASTALIASKSIEKVEAKPRRTLFGAANKRRKVAEQPVQEPDVLLTPPRPHIDHTSEVVSESIYSFPSRNEHDKEHQAEGGAPILDNSSVGFQQKEVSGDKALNAGAESRKRNSHLPDPAPSDVLRWIPQTKTMRPEDFEKLAKYNAFRPGALCSIRKGVPIPYQILEHVKIYYEEGLSESLRYFLRHEPSCPFLLPPFVSEEKPTQGVVKHATKLLNCICVSGRGDDSENQPPAFIPPASYITLLTTMMIHPAYTTDAKNGSEASENMVAAYNTLNNILEAVGPKAANMKDAFQFAKSATGGGRALRTKRTKRHVEEDSQSNSDDEQVGINHPLAQSDSVWNTATDLWHVVGWAFNCSMKHKNRWDYYRHWLKIVGYAICNDIASCEGNHEPISQSILGRTIIHPNMESLNKRVDTKPALKRAVAACFADGKEHSLKMFPEIWKDESNPAARAKAGENAEDLKLFDISRRLAAIDDDKYWKAGTEKEDEEAVVSFGGPQSLDLRCIFLVGLCDFDYNLFERKQATTDFYDIICDKLISLPYTRFSSFLYHFKTWALRGTFISLLQVCAIRLIDTKAPRNPNMDDSYDLSTLIKCYLPFAANTSSPEDNAKLAYCIWEMLHTFPPHPDGMLDHRLPEFKEYYGCEAEEIAQAVDTGTYARLEKCKNFKKAKNAKELEAAIEAETKVRDRIRYMGNTMHAFLTRNYVVPGSLGDDPSIQSEQP